jgi:hypothetical protein
MELEEWRIVEGASVWATKSLEIIEGALSSTVEATTIAREEITQELLPFGVVSLVTLLASRIHCLSTNFGCIVSCPGHRLGVAHYWRRNKRWSTCAQMPLVWRSGRVSCLCSALRLRRSGLRRNAYGAT